MKKVISRKSIVMLLSIVIIAAVIVLWNPTKASAEVSGDFEYSVNGNNATITKYTGTSSTVTIPNSIGGLVVKAIGEGAFAGNTSLISVSIPGTVTSLSPTAYTYSTGAFQNCTKLETIDIADGTSDAVIGHNAFRGCSSLKSVTLPGNYSSLVYYAFSNCISLKTFTWKQSTYKYSNQSIGDGVFADCTALSAISLPTTLKTISGAAFKNTAIESCVIPEGVVSIAEAAFADCAKLKSVSIPSTMISLSPTAYTYTTGAFQNCKKLETVEIADGTNDAVIGHNAFKDCSSLQALTVPGNYTTLVYYAFANCISLKSFVWKQSSYNHPNQTLGEAVFANCTALSTISLPTTLKTISGAAFKNTAIVSCVIPKGVTSISEAAFADCGKLKEVSIASTVTSLSPKAYTYTTGAFQNCPKLETVIIAEGPDDVTIGHNAFRGCSNLVTVHMPTNVKAAVYECFAGAPSTMTICNEAGTGFAKTYAEENGFQFKQCSGHPDFIPDKPDEPTPPPTISYTATFIDAEKTTSVQGETVTSPAISAYSGWSSNGWTTNPGLPAKAELNASSIVKLEKNVTYYALYTQPVSVTYNANGGSGAPSPLSDVRYYHASGLTQNAIVVLSSQKPTRNGNTFEGWSAAPSATEADCYPGDTIELSANITLYAVWNAEHTEHIYDQGVVTVPATCKNTGMKTYTCSVCGNTYTEVIEKTAHQNQKNVKAATLKKNGTLVYKCKTCGEVLAKKTIIRPETIQFEEGSLRPSFVYTGKAIKPKVVVINANGKAIPAKYYSVKYANNKNVGTATATITFKGYYSGTKTIKFTIVPKGTAIKSLTSKNNSAVLKWKKLTKQVDGYEIQYSTNKKYKRNTNTKVIEDANTTKAAVKSLRSETTYYFRIRTFKLVNGKKVYSAWSASKNIQI